ncbi:hypothetical protein NOF04DRAFT_2295 [Fusarium oxysporum II5]|uniref:Uncharacterized protein n=1 Tax=Fusarium odoratissimum (strain NRRL 54006) TaxID=1089451 RepID=X0KT21_FUSO5|nr:uncharacterized protein FOIG_01405 [Fusarium odoratissimum NRRL 54006]EXM11942.1 hypothetical protein FOIG_01405 [Fusarium odoratissimum NRRL 54006]KAK2136601.1 hypothetical protein NOF04DRAFT_2295 [Fusarium oxysporum II5]
MTWSQSNPRQLARVDGSWLQNSWGTLKKGQASALNSWWDWPILRSPPLALLPPTTWNCPMLCFMVLCVRQATMNFRAFLPSSAVQYYGYKVDAMCHGPLHGINGLHDGASKRPGLAGVRPGCRTSQSITQTSEPGEPSSLVTAALATLKRAGGPTTPGCMDSVPI